MPNISKEEVKEIVKEIGRTTFWLVMGVLVYAAVAQWVGG